MNDQPEQRRDEEVDLLVAGSGCAGLAAALVASVKGLSVVIVEKTEAIGGTTAYSAGTAWVPLADHARGRFDDDRAAVEQYLRTLTGDDGDAVRAAFLERGAEAVRFLEQNSELAFVMPDHAPDYRDEPGSVAAGRAIVAREYDGRRLGPLFALLREPRPGFTVLSGMMVGKLDIDALLAPLGSWKKFRHVMRILGRHALDRLRHRRGTRLVMGNALVGRLLESLAARGVEVRTRTELLSLIVEDGRVAGARIRRSDGTEAAIRTRRGVVLATGGASAGKRWRDEFVGGEDFGLTTANAANTGDGLTAASGAGAAIDGPRGRGAGYWFPASALRSSSGEDVLFPHIILDRAKPGLLAIDRAGRRFVNEAASYHDFSMAIPEWKATPQDAPAPAWLVCDKRFIHRYGLGFIRPGRLSLRLLKRKAYVVEAPDLATLARRIGVPEDALAGTVAAHNGFAATGRDEQFAKGTTRLNRQNGDASHGPNPCIGPIDRPPYYALGVWPTTLGTSMGVVTDASGRALREDGAAIDGLYAVGNDMRSIMRHAYPGPGVTIGPALVFAYLAAVHAAGGGAGNEGS